MYQFQKIMFLSSAGCIAMMTILHAPVIQLNSVESTRWNCNTDLLRQKSQLIMMHGPKWLRFPTNPLLLGYGARD